MKRIIFLFAYITLSFPLFAQPVVVQRVNLQANNIKSIFQNTGIFNQNTSLANQSGCEWPAGSGKYVCFTAGLTIAGFIGDSLAYTSASYRGEYAPGTVVNGVFTTNSNFKIYSIKAGDNCSNNLDYANWGFMVPYGAPFKDVNQNGMYNCGIDIPGMPDAKQTIFMCLTDANVSQHSTGEGFGGGLTSPLLKSQVAITAWGYDYPTVNNAQFIKYVITNKNNVEWNKTYFGFYTDSDIGDAEDDRVGCAPSVNLGYTYNGDNNDADYGVNPPAFGMAVLRSPYMMNGSNHDTLGMTSFSIIQCNGCPSANSCMVSPGNCGEAHNFMRGLKKDGTPVLNPTITSGTRITKHWFSGDPETNTGWNETQGYIPNCGGDTTMTNINQLSQGDRRMLIAIGNDNLKLLPGEKTEIVIAQFVERGSSNLNSVTLLKNRAASLKTFYNTIANSTSISHNNEIVVNDYKLYQNYPNPFNPETKIKFDIPKTSQVQLEVFDISGKLVATLVNEELNSGQYTVKFDASKLSSGIYIYRMRAGNVVYSNKMLLLK